MSVQTHAYSALPDPEFRPEFYADTPSKRGLAWLVDSVLIAILVAIAVPFTAFTALLFLPLLYLMIGFLYRWVSLARWSATPGMLFFAVEFRTLRGARMDSAVAFVHTLAYTVSTAMVLPQILSIGLMLTSARRQGLSDLVLGTVAMNRAA